MVKLTLSFSESEQTDQSTSENEPFSETPTENEVVMSEEEIAAHELVANLSVMYQGFTDREIMMLCLYNQNALGKTLAEFAEMAKQFGKGINPKDMLKAMMGKG